jgi:hypothetical protein
VQDAIEVKLSGVRQSEECWRGLEKLLCYWKWYKKKRLWDGFLQNEKHTYPVLISMYCEAERPSRYI